MHFNLVETPEPGIDTLLNHANIMVDFFKINSIVT